MRRVVVVGCSGSGKSTLARELSQRLGLRHVEIDALHHEENWTPAPREVFLQRIEQAIECDGWAVDGNYSTTRALVWPRADTVVWLDYPMGLVYWRIFRRTFLRCFNRELLWGTNYETWKISFFSRHSMLVWVWSSWRENRVRYSRLRRSREFAHLRWLRFVSPAQTQQWLDRIIG